MKIEDKLKIQTEIKQWLFSKLFTCEYERIFTHRDYPDLKVYVCYYPCNWGTIIQLKEVDIFKDENATLEQVQKAIHETSIWVNDDFLKLWKTTCNIPETIKF